MEQIEEWKPIPSYPNYEVSNNGQVRNIITQKVLKPNTTNKGYKRIGLWKNNKSKTMFIHRLVLLAFVGESSLGVRHLDNNPANNNLSNLAYGTMKENTDDKKKHDTCSPNLKAADVKLIRLMKSFGFTYRLISQICGVSTGCVYEIVKGKTWSWLT